MDSVADTQQRSSLSPTRPHMSITMPPALGQFYTDGQMPRTPKNDEDELLHTEPPPPPQQTYKIKRKRVITQPMDIETIIPTIEMSEVLNSPDMPSPVLELTTPTNGLLAPIPHMLRSLTPPKTPAARILTSFDQLESPGQEWALITNNSERRSFERTGSIGSSFSDSSLSSLGSSLFSTTSPVSETTDPFLEDVLHSSSKTPILPADSPDAKRIKTSRRTAWTPAMDDHLWLTYMAYLSDPTLTPFKMLPGTAPPLGVCHRVASKAKRTWRDHRTVSGASISLDSIFSSERAGSPDTIRPESSKMAQLRTTQWPRSESETRKRLRALCKKRPSLSAHYQRLLRTRSPSPFQSSGSSAQRLSEPPTNFSNGDMKISLITSTSSTMQPDGPLATLITSDRSSMRPDGPLAQLATDELPAASPPSAPRTRPDGWFTRIGRSQAHQKSLSLQSGLGLVSDTILASPFEVSRSHLLQSSAVTKSLGRDFNRSAPFLDSPFEGAPTAPRSLKRRFRSDEEKPRRLPLTGIFGQAQPQPLTGLRSRGFSLGSSNASDEIARLFHPPRLDASIVLQAPTPQLDTPAVFQAPTPSTSVDHDMLDTPDISMLGPPGSRSAPRRLAEPTPRLGSPFMETSTSRPFNTLPRTFAPTADDPQPFQRRLQELVQGNQSEQ